ncbi:TPA: hypothetical protein EYP26_04375, partial [Candidatus Bathyarchaeota archaeon]|nr:hypothetical protein [Candidatus Bathyarchaeota archaeon]
MRIEFISEMSILLGASLGLIFLMKYLRLPTATGVLIAGMVIGPYGLGLVKNLPVINALAELGVILLLFLIGLELNPREVGPLGAKAALLAALEISVSFALGFAVGVALAWSLVDSFVLASILSISSTAIVGKTILDEFKLKLTESQLIVSTLIIEDLFVIFLLVLMPVVLAGAGSPTQLLLVALKAAALISIILPLSNFL